MPSFEALRHRLLSAGQAPSHVGRYLAELEDHFADLITEEGGGASARTAALRRLGTVDDLAAAMISRDCFCSWTSKAPWAVFPLSALTGLAGAYGLAVLLLMAAVKVFCPLVDGHPMPPVWLPRAGDLLFAFNRFLLPILVGWSIATFALTRRQRPLWPIVAMVGSALLGSGLYCRADWPTEPRSWSFCVSSLLDGEPILWSGWEAYGTMVLVNFCVVLLPYLSLSHQRREIVR